jgi:two-component system, sensor histidine kinase and response regulator
MPAQVNKKSRILVVDDEEPNLRLLSAMLASEGYELISATDGPKALEMTAKAKPDVVLLDVMMPGLSGFEVCRRLKADPDTAAIPVLLVTSLHQRENRLNGMMAGANDFVTKPIDQEDLLLRVRNAAYAKRLYDEIQSNYEKLKELERLRDNLTHMIVHDLRSPLSGISGYLQLLEMAIKDAANPKAGEYLVKSMNSLNVLMEMINSLLDINRMEEGKMPLTIRQCDVRNLPREALETLGASKNKCSVAIECGDDLPLVSCDPDIIRRVIANLLGNALKFTPDKGQITVAAVVEGNTVRVSVRDNGRGIPPEYHGKIFEKFGQVEMRQENKMYSTGLGLTFCKLAVEAHGGKIGVISEPEKGNTFWFTLAV